VIFVLDGFQLNAPKQYYFTPVELQNATNKIILKSRECSVTPENKQKTPVSQKTPSQLFSLLKGNHACIYDSS